MKYFSVFSILLFLLLIVLISFLFHYMMPNFKKACWGTTISVGLIIPGISSLLVGYIDPFIVVEIIIFGVISYFVSVMVGTLMGKHN